MDEQRSRVVPLKAPDGAGAVERIVTKERFHLLERLAERIADEVRADERVQRVTVTVRKLRPPVAVDLASAAVTITRP